MFIYYYISGYLVLKVVLDIIIIIIMRKQFRKINKIKYDVVMMKRGKEQGRDEIMQVKI